ncbi:MAG: metallophosphoesterase [Victivallales bacterium]|nr:metallophosphoesterase [Victivallales bacterium]
MSKPANIFRILQLSDLHTGILDFQLGYCLDKRFFGRLNQATMRQRRLTLDRISAFARLQRELEADFTVCTGDLTSIGSEAEFLHCEELLKEVLENAGEAFAFVPGNHDAYVRRNRPALAAAFRRLNGGKIELDMLPAVRRVGAVEFILLNAARPCAIWLSTGELSDAVWEKLDYILSSRESDVKARVLVCHFPMCDHLAKPLSWRTKLMGYERLVEWAKQGRFDAMLTGHVHYPFVHHIGGSQALAVGAGSLTIYQSCAQIDIDTSTGHITARNHFL